MKQNLAMLIRLNVNDWSNNFEKQFTITVNNLNEASTDITLTSTDVDENASWWTLIWSLWNVDEDTWNTYTYTLSSWTWDTDNWSFTVTWTWLTINSNPDFETQSGYTIRLNVNDWANDFSKQFSITINDINESPTDLTLSWSTIDENVSWWTTVWTLWNVDEDTWNTYTYSLTSWTWDTDNWSFTVSWTNLNINSSPDFETQSGYTIRLNVNDWLNNFSKQFAITVNDLNIAPTDIALNSTDVDENVTWWTTVWVLSWTDDNENNSTLTFSLSCTTAWSDDWSFTVSWTNLNVNSSPDFETKSSYSICLRVSDGNLIFDENFTITINNLNESPTDITLTSTDVDENVSWWTLVWSLWNVDEDTWNTYTYALSSWTWDTDNWSFTVTWTWLTINSSPDFETQSGYTIRLNVNDWANDFSKQFTITINNLNESPTDLTLTSTDVDENVSWWTLVWSLWNVDEDTWNTYTYALSSWTWDTDNWSFTVTWTWLTINSSPDFETQSGYTIRLNVNDWANDFSKQFSITINDINESPTDLTLSWLTMDDNILWGALVWDLWNVDEDTWNTYTYALSSWTWDTDNWSFTVTWTWLTINSSPDYLTQSGYTIRLNVNDWVNDFSKSFNLTVLDKTAPTFNSVSIKSNNSNDTSWAKIWDEIEITFELNESVVLPVVTILWNSATVTQSWSTNTYTATYTTWSDTEWITTFTIDVSDTFWNSASQVTSTTDSSKVTFDRTKPVITMNVWNITGNIDMVYWLYGNYSDPWAIPTDNLDTNISSKLTIIDNRPSPGPNVSGHYTIIYSLEDIAWNIANVQTRQVKVNWSSASKIKKIDVCNDTKWDKSWDYYDGKCLANASDNSSENSYEENKQEDTQTNKEDNILKTDREEYGLEDDMVENYRIILNDKFWTKISKYSDSQKALIINKIDSLLKQYSDKGEPKSKLSLLVAFKELLNLKEEINKEVIKRRWCIKYRQRNIWLKPRYSWKL